MVKAYCYARAGAACQPYMYEMLIDYVYQKKQIPMRFLLLEKPIP